MTDLVSRLRALPYLVPIGPHRDTTDEAAAALEAVEKECKRKNCIGLEEEVVELKAKLEDALKARDTWKAEGGCLLVTLEGCIERLRTCRRLEVAPAVRLGIKHGQADTQNTTTNDIVLTLDQWDTVISFEPLMFEGSCFVVDVALWVPNDKPDWSAAQILMGYYAGRKLLVHRKEKP